MNWTNVDPQHYFSNNCNGSITWDCVNGTCIDPGTGNGAYNSLCDCNTACIVTPSWDCISPGNCQDPNTGNGLYSTQAACLSACVAPSWDCDVQGNCYDPGTGNGIYTTQAACIAVCGVNAIEEHTTNKQLLKITDILGREVDEKRNTPLFYIYNDGTVEKKIIIE